MYRLEIRRSASPSQRYYVRGVSLGNNEVLFSTETYYQKIDAVKVAKIIGGGASSIIDMSQ